MGKLNYRVVIFIFAFIFGVVFSIPSLLQSDAGKKITLGLDLQGGLHMLLSVKSDIAVESKLKSIGTTLKYKLEDEDIIFDSLKIADGVVSFELLDKDDLPKLEEILKEDFKDISIKRDGLNFSISLNQKLIEQTKENAIKQAVDTIRNRLNMYGLAEPTVAKQGKDKILVEIPGVKTSEDEQRIRELIAKAAHLQMMAVDEDRASRVDSMSEAEAKSYGDIILPDVADPKRDIYSTQSRY